MLDEKARLGARSHVPPYRASVFAHLAPRLGDVFLVSYGGREELAAEREHPGLRVLCNEWGLPPAIYAQQLPWLHRRAFRRADLVRAEQVYAAPAAERIARIFGKPLVVRYGYAPSVLARAARDRDPVPLEELERSSCEQADLVIVTTGELQRHLEELGCRRVPPIEIVPNCVRCSDFPPVDRSGDPDGLRLLSVGRLAPQKNFESLLDAVVDSPGLRLDIVGKGPLRERLAARIGAPELGHVRLLGWLAPQRVFELYREADVYVQPTLAEGHPKTLLEAMAAGLPIVATGVLGNRELLRHGETAWLCGTSSAELRAAIATVAGDHELRRRLGRSARAEALARYDLPVVAEAELRAIERARALPGRPPRKERRRLVAAAFATAATLARALGARIGGALGPTRAHGVRDDL